MAQRHKVSRSCWKNGISRLAQFKVTINLQFVKNTVSEKHSQMRYAYALCFSAFMI